MENEITNLYNLMTFYVFGLDPTLMPKGIKMYSF